MQSLSSIIKPRFLKSITDRYFADAQIKLSQYLTEKKVKNVLVLDCGTGSQLAALHKAKIQWTALAHNSEQLQNCQDFVDNFGASKDSVIALDKFDLKSQAVAENTYDAVIIPQLLSKKAEASLELISFAHNIAKNICILDYSSVERNMDFVFRPWLHGFALATAPNYYSEFKQYLRIGGFDGLIYKYNLQQKQNNKAILNDAYRQRFRAGTAYFLALTSV